MVAHGADEGDDRPGARMLDDVEEEFRRPRNQWWLEFEAVSQAVSFKGTEIKRALPIRDA